MAVALGGCSSEPAGVDGSDPYAAQFAQEMQNTDSDYVKKILSDGKIDPSEYQDARQHVEQCASDAGFQVSYAQNDYGDWSITLFDQMTDDQFDQLNVCQKEWMGPISQLYWNMYVNPSNDDWNTLVAACLVRKGLEPVGFTGQDYDDLMNSWGMHGTTATMTPDAHGKITVTSTEPMVPPTLPGGESLVDEDGLWCMTVPLQ